MPANSSRLRGRLLSQITSVASNLSPGFAMVNREPPSSVNALTTGSGSAFMSLTIRKSPSRNSCIDDCDIESMCSTSRGPPSGLQRRTAAIPPNTTATAANMNAIRSVSLLPFATLRDLACRHDSKALRLRERAHREVQHIDAALAALGSSSSGSSRRNTLSAATRRKISAAQKLRWARQKGDLSEPSQQEAAGESLQLSVRGGQR